MTKVERVEEILSKMSIVPLDRAILIVLVEILVELEMIRGR